MYSGLPANSYCSGIREFTQHGCRQYSRLQTGQRTSPEARMKVNSPSQETPSHLTSSLGTAHFIVIW